MTPRAERVAVSLEHDFDGTPVGVQRSDPPISVRRVASTVSHTSSFATTITFAVNLINEETDERWIESWDDLARLDAPSRDIVMGDLLDACDALIAAGYDIDTSDFVERWSS